MENINAVRGRSVCVCFGRGCLAFQKLKKKHKKIIKMAMLDLKGSYLEGG